MSDPSSNPSQPEELTRTCPDCAHENPMQHRFCEACGGALRSADRASTAAGKAAAGTAPAGRAARAQRARPARSRRARARDEDGDEAEAAAAVGGADDKLEKARARAEFARTKAVAFRLRNVYAVGILVALSQLALFWKFGQMGRLEEHQVWIGYAVFGISLLVKVAGTLLVLQRPLTWAVVVAVEQSILLGFVLWFGGPLLDTILSGFFFVVFWAVVVSAARLQRVLDENPELQLRRGKVDRARLKEDGVSQRARGMRQQSRAALWRTIGIGAAVIAAVVALVVILNLPPGLSGREEPFRRAWASGRLEAFEPMSRGSFERSYGDHFAARGWDRKMPKLGDCTLTLDEGETSGNTVFAIEGGGEVSVRWGFDRVHETWRIVGMQLPEIDYAPFEPFAERFEQAWEQPGGAGILELWDPDANPSRVQRSFERREWWQERPAVRDRALGARGEGRTLELDTDDGIVVTTWEYRHPKWQVRRIRFP